MSKIKLWLACSLLCVAAFLCLSPLLEVQKAMSQSLDARRSLLQALGQHLSQRHYPDCVLVLSNPFAQKRGQRKEIRQFGDAGIQGLQEGLAKTTRLKVVRPKIKIEYRDNPQNAPLPADAKNPLSFLMEASSIDEISKSHPDCKMIVSLIGLPAEVGKLKVWQKDNAVKFALLMPDLRVIGQQAKVLNAFQSGKIAAAVVPDPASGKPLIIDAGNVEEVFSSHPGLLGFRKRR